KVLAVREALPASWPVHGTTGYDALREICGVFVDHRAEEPLTALAAEFDEQPDPFGVMWESKQQVVNSLLYPEVRRVAALIGLLPGTPPTKRCEEVAAALLAAFPIYRSYLPEHGWAVRHAVDDVAAVRPELAGIAVAV